MNDKIRPIQSIQRAIDIINCFDEAHPALSIAEISEKTELHVNTTRGIVNTLLYNGYLSHDLENNKYSLGLIFIPKSELVTKGFIFPMKEMAEPYMKEIANTYNVSARLQMIANNNIVTVKTVNPVNARYLIYTRIDTPFPLNATSSGKLFLYYSDDDEQEYYLDHIAPFKYTEHTIIEKKELKKELEFIKKNQYSAEREEISIGINSVAVPIVLGERLVGTISITASSAIVDSIHNDVVRDLKEIVNIIMNSIAKE